MPNIRGKSPLHFRVRIAHRFLHLPEAVGTGTGTWSSEPVVGTGLGEGACSAGYAGIGKPVHTKC